MAPMYAIWLVLVKTQPTRPPTTLLPYRSATGIDYGSKKYLKWWEIQLVITQQLVNKQLQKCGKFDLSISFPSRVIVLQIIKILIFIIMCGRWVISNPFTNNNTKEVKELQQTLHDGTPLILLNYFTMMYAWCVHIGVYDKSGHELTLRIILSSSAVTTTKQNTYNIL